MASRDSQSRICILGLASEENEGEIIREKPQGVGFLFLPASLKITEKKPQPPGAFPEKPLYHPHASFASAE